MLYETLFEALDEAVCFLEKLATRPDGRRDFRYLAANRAMRALIGVDDLTGRSSRDTFTDDSETWYDDFDRVLATGEAARFERETPHGLALSVFVSRVEDGTGSRLLAVMRDVTARKRADAALRENETRYRTLFNTIDEGFCIIEFFDGPHGPLSDYVHVEANPAYERHAGISNVVGQKVREMVPHEADGWVELYRRVLVTGEPIRFDRELVATGRHLELSAFRVEPQSRKQVAVLFQDVTDQRRAASALRASEQQWRQMADTMAHMI
jgi:PAS domain S-box-containing protein